MTLIADSSALAAFCQRHAETEFVTVDTEFMRDKTFWPILCLVQVGGPKEAVAIDPLAPDIDLSHQRQAEDVHATHVEREMEKIRIEDPEGYKRATRAA